MSGYPAGVEKIVKDYADRLRIQIRILPPREQGEILQEIDSHVYESFCAETEGDEIDRILRVLRRLGEPGEVAAHRIPGTMVEIGKRKRLPLYILGGALMVLFGVPLGLGGVALLVGVLVAVLGLLVSYCALGVCLTVAGALLILAGILMMFNPGFISQLLMLGSIHIDLGLLVPDQAPFFLSGIAVLLIGGLLATLGLLILWSSKFAVRGLRFVVCLISGKIREHISRKRSLSRLSLSPPFSG